MVQKIGGNGGLHVTCVLVIEIRKTYIYSKKGKKKKREGKHTTWAGSPYMILLIADIFISICHNKKHPTN